MKATRRRSCPADRKRALLEKQGFTCHYCGLPFGCVIRKGNTLKLSVVHFDHAIPFAYLDGNPEMNWVVACNFCNQFKSSDVFSSWEDVTRYIAFCWERKRMSVEWLTPVSSEADPERWAVKFGTYLASMPPRLAGSITLVRPWTKPKKKAA